jgi:hypothetical protein
MASRRSIRWWVAVALALLVLEPAVAPAQTTGGVAQSPLRKAYDDAVNTFKYQDFEQAVGKLRALLYPQTSLDRDRELTAREYLGAALWWQGRGKEAQDEFTALLARRNQARLSPTSYPPKMVADFDELRQNLLRLGVIHADAVEIPDGVPPLSVVLFPFGVGQFANRQPWKGAAFLGSELLLGSVSVAAWLRAYEQRLRGESSSSAVAVELISGAAFFLVASWGIYDAVSVRRSQLDRLAEP